MNAALTAAPAAPVVAAAPACPSERAAMTASGKIVSIGKTPEGAVYYLANAKKVDGSGKCRVSELGIYPAAAVASCTVGATFEASGAYTSGCIATAVGPICTFKLNQVTLSCGAKRPAAP